MGPYRKSRLSLELAERCGMKFQLGSAHRLLGEIALSTNPTQVEPPLAAPHLERSVAILEPIHADNELALAYAGYGRLHRQQGRVPEAREYLTRALEIFERLGTLIEPDKVRAELAQLPAASCDACHDQNDEYAACHGVR